CLTRRNAFPQQGQRFHAAGSGGDRDAQQEREARGRRAVDAAQEPGGDRDARARGARNQRQGLGAADRQGLPERDALERIAWDRRRRRGPPIGNPHDDRPSCRRHGNDERRAKLALDELLEEDTGQGARDRGQDEQNREPARERARSHAEELATKIGEERRERAEVHDRVEGESLIAPAEDVRHEDQVTGRRNGEELGEPLDEAENHPLSVGHPTISSPPSTPITLPVIQYVSGWERTTMARATSSVVVMRPLGLRRRASAMIASWRGIFCSAGVSVTPARIAFAVMPCGASSEASWRICDSSAAFAA